MKYWVPLKLSGLTFDCSLARVRIGSTEPAKCAGNGRDAVCAWWVSSERGVEVGVGVGVTWVWA